MAVGSIVEGTYVCLSKHLPVLTETGKCYAALHYRYVTVAASSAAIYVHGG